MVHIWASTNIMSGLEVASSHDALVCLLIAMNANMGLNYAYRGAKVCFTSFCENVDNIFQEFAVFIVLKSRRRNGGFTDEVQRCHAIREVGTTSLVTSSFCM